MINVKQDKSLCNFIESYWLNNLIIDHSKNISKEKLNNNYTIEINTNNNDYGEKYNDNVRNTNTNKSNNARKYSKNSSRERYRKQDTNIRMHSKEESCENRIFQKYSNTSESKGEMHSLPEKCRIHEYEFRERKVLLDSFSKPKLTEKIKN
jgi:hypothetical protein